MLLTLLLITDTWLTEAVRQSAFGRVSGLVNLAPAFKRGGGKQFYTRRVSDG